MTDIEEKKREILNYLKTIAEKDQRISRSEEKILELVERSLNEYEILLNKAKEDGKITDEEKVSLYFKRMDILKEALAISEEDNLIEADEDAILVALTEKLKELSIHSFDFS